MIRHMNKIVGQCHQQTLNKIVIATIMAVTSWLSVCSAASHAQRLHVYRPRVKVGPVAEKPKPLPPANAPKILSITSTKKHRITISFRDFAAKVSSKKFELERQTVGSSAWHAVYTMTARDHRIPFDPHMRDHRRQPGAKYVHHDTTFLVTGRKYRYRVRATIPYEPQPMVLLSVARTITLKPVEYPTPPIPTPTDPAPTDPAPTDPAPTDPAPTDPNQHTADTKTIYLRAKQIGPFFRPYVAISLIPGEITAIEIPEVNGQSLDVYFVKPGYKLFEYASNPEATVMLTSGQTSTPSQIGELFGTVQKKRHVKFVAFVRASQGNSPNLVGMKVSYSKTN
jgi:hypothetical protein